MADRFEALYLGSIFNKKKTPPCCALVAIEDSDTVTHTGLGTIGDPFVFTATGGGGGTITGANNGASVNGANVQLGQSIGTAGDPAQLLEDSEIPLETFVLRFSGTQGTVLIGNATLITGGYQFQTSTDVTVNGIPLGRGPNNVAGNVRLGEFTMVGAVTGGNNTAIGTGALISITSGQRNQMLGHNCGNFITSGNFNSGFGESALRGVTTGSSNTGVGYQALQSTSTTINHTGIGANAGTAGGSSILNGNSCTFIGANTTFTNNAIDTATAVGAGVSLAQSNTVILGTATESVGIGTSTPTSKLDVTGINSYAQLRLRSTYTPTSSADANGNTGDFAWDSGFVYVKTGAGAWKRATLTTF